MGDASSKSTVAWKDIPPPRGRVFVSCLDAIVSFFVLAAIVNLASFRSVPLISTLAAIAWLLLVGVFIHATLHSEGGIRQFAVNRLG